MSWSPSSYAGFGGGHQNPKKDEFKFSMQKAESCELGNLNGSSQPKREEAAESHGTEVRKPNVNAVFEYLAGVWDSYLKQVDLTCQLQ